LARFFGYPCIGFRLNAHLDPPHSLREPFYAILYNSPTVSKYFIHTSEQLILPYYLILTQKLTVFIRSCKNLAFLFTGCAYELANSQEVISRCHPVDCLSNREKPIKFVPSTQSRVYQYEEQKSKRELKNI
jgi:hypothetical protein